MTSEFVPDRVHTLIRLTEDLLTAVSALQHGLKLSAHHPQANLNHAVSMCVMHARAAINDLKDETVVGSEEREGRPGRGGFVSRHESYGTIGVSRTVGDVRLFGSVKDTHSSFMCLRIQRARAEKGDGDADLHVTEDYGNPDRHIVEVFMSSAQWAEMITTMNVANGVPCTLRSVRGRDMAKVPAEYQDNPDRIIEEFKQRLKDAPVNGAAKLSALKTMLASSSLSKKAAAEIYAVAASAHEDGAATACWTLQEFSSHAAKLRAAHMTELDASITGVVQRLGLEKLRDILDAAPGPVMLSGNVVDVEET